VAQVDKHEVTLEGGRQPLHPTAFGADQLGWDQVAVLDPAQGAALMEALNQLGAPCEPCWQQGWSYSKCLLERPPACTELLGRLLDRGVGLAGLGARTADLRTALRYDDLWVDVPWEDVTAVADGWGEASAMVQVVLVVDLQSPFCARVSDSWQALLDEGGSALQVRILFWTEERHPRSGPAALAAMAAAAQGQLWAYSRLLLSRYQHLDDAGLVAAATELGLDLAAFDRVRAAPASLERLQAQRVLAEALGARSAPTAFVDGFRLRGARPHPQLSSLLARAFADRVPGP